MSEEIERFQPREVDYYRSRNLPSFATWLVPTLPAGVAFGALSLHSIPLLVLGLVLAVAGAVWIFRRYPMVAPQFVEFRDDDYSFWYKYSWIAPLIPIGPLYGLIEPTLPHLELEPPLLLVSAGAASTPHSASRGAHTSKSAGSSALGRAGFGGCRTAWRA